MYIGGYNHLNTIEEEKHETQTSNYFKEGESERDDSSKYMQNFGKNSKILADISQEKISQSTTNAKESKKKKKVTEESNQYKDDNSLDIE